MKKSWSKLLTLATKAAGKTRQGKTNYYVADQIYTHLFLKHHQYADSLCFDREGRPLEAIYKCGDMRDEIKNDLQKSDYQDGEYK